MSVIKRLETVYNLLASRKVYLCEYDSKYHLKFPPSNMDESFAYF